MNFSNMVYECISRQVRITSISCGVQEVERLLINRQKTNAYKIFLLHSRTIWLYDTSNTIFSVQ